MREGGILICHSFDFVVGGIKMFRRKKKVIKISTHRRKKFRFQPDKLTIIVGAIVAIIIGLVLGFMPNAYLVTIGEKKVGAVKEEGLIDEATKTVLEQLKQTYHTNVKLEESQMQVKKVRAQRKDYVTTEYLMSAMRKNLNVLLEVRELKVDGEKVGIIASDEVLEELKEALKKEYYGKKEVKVEFAKEVTTEPVFAKEADILEMDKLVEKCTTTTPKEVEYVVQTGDSLSGIASKLGTTMARLQEENPSIGEKGVVRIGETLKAKVNQPLLTLKEVEELTPNKEKK